MIVFDSSVWIALLNEIDSQHQKALRAFSDLRAPILLPEYVVLEVYTVLAIRVSKTQADAFLRLTSDNQDIHILLTDETFFLAVVTACQQQKYKGLSFTDTALVVLSAEHTVITFDRVLQKAI